LENLGAYDPIKHEVSQLKKDRISDWVSKGAICSDAVKKIMRIGNSSK
jgi:ribosomal protein S16